MSEVEALIHVKEYDADEVRAAASLFKKKTGGNVSGLGDTGGRTPLHLVRARPRPLRPRAPRATAAAAPHKTLARRVPLIRPVPSPTPLPLPGGPARRPQRHSRPRHGLRHPRGRQGQGRRHAAHVRRGLRQGCRRARAPETRRQARHQEIRRRHGGPPRGVQRPLGRPAHGHVFEERRERRSTPRGSLRGGADAGTLDAPSDAGTPFLCACARGGKPPSDASRRRAPTRRRRFETASARRRSRPPRDSPARSAPPSGWGAPSLRPPGA